MILSTILRSKAAVSKVGLAGSSIAQHYAQQSFTAGNSNATRQDRFSYDNILSRLSISESYDEVYNIYANNKDKFNTEHFAMVCRAYGRIYRKTSVLPNRESHYVLEKRLIEELPKLNSQQCTDFLFMMRSLNESGIMRIPREKLEEFLRKLNEHIEAKSYNFRSCVSIYYDLALINRLNRQIRQQVHDKFLEEVERGSLRNLSMFNISMILKAMSTQTELFGLDLHLYEKLIEYIESNSLYKESSIDEKAALFLQLARIFNANNVHYPRFMRILEQEFIEKMENLTERSILSIIEASTLLPPRSFTVGNYIRKVLLDNMSNPQNAEAIEPSFFIDCMSRFTYGRRRRFSATEVQKAVEYLLSQIPFKDKTNRTEDKLVRLVNSNNLFSFTDSVKIIEKLLKRSAFAKLDLIELAINFNVNVNESAIRFFEQNKEKQEKLQNFKAIRLYMILTAIPEANFTESLKPILKEVEAQVDEILQGEWWMVVKANKNSLIRDHYKNTFYTKLMNRIDKLKPEELSRESSTTLFLSLIKISVNKTLNIRVKEWVQKHKELLNKPEMRRGLENAIRDTQETTHFFQMLTLYNMAELGLARMNILLKETDLVKHTQRFGSLSGHLVSMLREIYHVPGRKIVSKVPEDEDQEVAPTTYKQVYKIEESTPFIWSTEFETVLKKFEEARYDSNNYRSVLVHIATNPVKFINKRSCAYLIELLFSKGLLDKNVAESIQSSMKNDKLNEQSQRTGKGFSDYLLDAMISNEKFPYSFNFEPLRARGLALLLQYNPKFYQSKIPAIMEFVTKSELSPRDWFNLVMSLRKLPFETNDYTKIVYYIFRQFDNYSKNMRTPDMTRLAFKAERIYYREKTFWFKIHKEVILGWDELNLLERFTMLELLVNQGIDVGSEIKTLMDGIKERGLSNLQGESRRRFLDLLGVGNYKLSSEYIETVEKLVTARPLNSYESINFLKVLACNPHFNKAAEYVKEAYTHVKEHTNPLRNSMLFEYLSKAYPEAGISFTKNEELRELATTHCKEEMNELKEYFDKAAALINQPVEYGSVINGVAIDVVFAGHLIKFTNRSTANFYKSSRATLNNVIIKAILEQDLKRPVTIIQSKWFIRDPLKFLRLKSAIPELEAYTTLKSLDKQPEGKTEGKTEGKPNKDKKGKTLDEDDIPEYEKA